jgi:adenylate cyclase
MFSRFISPEMVTQLLDTQDISSLNKRTELTILFSDIRGFTTISERLSPEEVVGLLNPYLEVMSEVIHKHGGTVDKYEGDAIVAFFGEPMPFPDHALRAAKASLEMRLELKILTDGWKAEGRFTDIFEMGIGLNTGEVFVGLLGSEQRINYTVIGDAANLAARLQDQTKEFGYPILISGETNEQIKSEIKTEFVASRILKGKSEPVEIFRVILPDEGPRMII